MNNFRDITVSIPVDTSVLGMFYIREFSENGYMYNSADSKVFMLDGVDGIDLASGKTYTMNENGEWNEIISNSIITDEELAAREALEEALEENDEEDEEGAPSTEE